MFKIANLLKSKSVLIGLFTLLSFSSYAREIISLAGSWNVKLDSTDIGLENRWYQTSFSQQINLPGTTDEAGIGIPNKLTPKFSMPQVLYLTRKNSYIGVAWYSKVVDIPSGWKNKSVVLKLERVIWQSRLWIDGKEAGALQESLIAPHYYDLTSKLTPGKHKLVIRIDNRKKYDISVPTKNSPNGLAHAYSEETQTIWNGIIGEISLEKRSGINISSIQTFPDVSQKRVDVVIRLNNPDKKQFSGNITLCAKDLVDKKNLPGKIVPVKISDNDEIRISYPMGDRFRQWSEQTPDLYNLSVILKNKAFSDSLTTVFGMRSLTNRNSHIQINGQNIFLRGTLECCVFPKTACPPMDKAGWGKVFKTARSYGLNHLRFHSWCPPKYAFEVADEMGFYLQIELPLWSLTVNQDTATSRFLYEEADRIIREYGNHPSFCFWSIGNELQPDFKYLNDFVARLKNKDPRHLYTSTTFTFEKGHGLWPEPNDDYYITQYTKKGWVRGQGIFGTQSPSFDVDYSASVDSIPVPIVTHEVGQYCVYPNVNEIPKYTGVLEPLNFMAVRNDLEKKGLLSKANDYLMASGKLAAVLYKEEIERALKTKGASGFQLLDLHDFPGQGTALVGLLDAFWDSKGLITPEEFRSFCSQVVPLARFGKPVFKNSEVFTAEVEVANYSGTNLSNPKVLWQIYSSNGAVYQSGEFIPNEIPNGKNTAIGKISAALSSVQSAEQIYLKVRIENSPYQNSWKLWVYPANARVESGNVVYTRDFRTAQNALLKGQNVLYNPDWKKLTGIEGKFIPVFWSPVHFPKQAATMGVLCNPGHPALKLFPTDMHSDWQWWDLNTNSKTIILDSMQGVKPIVEMVDNWVNNRRLGLVFETKAGNGKLIYTSIDLNTDLDNRPQAKQLLISLLSYMNSNQFKPESQIDFNQLLKFESDKVTDEKSKPTDIY